MNVARSVINLFSGENKATLSGGIDIIAVENENGDILTTPFHVRFGRLSGVLNPKEKVVSITVNGEKTNAKMKLGPAGEAFFVEETRVSLHHDLCTSPLISPLPSPEIRGREVTAVMEMLSLDSDGEDDGGNDKKKNTNNNKSLTVDTKPQTTETDEKYWEKYALLSPDSSNTAIRKSSTYDILSRDDGRGNDDSERTIKKKRRPSASPPTLNLEEVADDTEKKEVVEEDVDSKSSSWSWRWGWGDVNPHRRKTPHGKSLETMGKTAMDVLASDKHDSSKTSNDIDDNDDDDEQFSTARSLPSRTGKNHLEKSDRSSSNNMVESENAGDEVNSAELTISNSQTNDNASNTKTEESFIKSVKISMCAHLISKAQDTNKYVLNGENLEVFFQQHNIINQNDFKPEMLDDEKLLFLVNNSEFYQWNQLSPLVLNMEDIDTVKGDTQIEDNSDSKEEDDTSNGAGGFFAWLRGSGKRAKKVDGTKSTGNTNGRIDLQDHSDVSGNSMPIGMTRSPSSSMDDTFLSISIDGDNPEGLPPARSISPALTDEINLSQDAKINYGGELPKSYNGVYYRKTLRPPSRKTLSTWGLKKDMNEIEFSVTTTSGQIVIVKSRIFLWPSNSKIVISDVDGTITKSDLLGHIMPRFGVNYSHEGVVSLYSTIEKHGYKLMYLSSRPIGQSNQTKNYLGNLEENDLKLPHGPVVLSPDRLFQSLAREVIYKRPQDFKVPALRDIRNLFPKNQPSPFYAGFGNRDSDKIAYKSVGVPPGKIFIVNSSGVIVTENLTMGHSYSSIHELKHHVFPDISVKKQQQISTHASFNDTNFWKQSIMNIDTDEDDDDDDDNEIGIEFSRNGAECNGSNAMQQGEDDQVFGDNIMSNVMATIM
jgi:phosphatidate phosphatase PAH1